MNPIEKRTQRIAESILENEALTADLDDAAAQALLDWGLSLAEKIARSTAGLNDQQAEEAMYHPMRSMRRMLRTAGQFAAAPDPQKLEKFLERASETYGEKFSSPMMQTDGEELLRKLPVDSIQRIIWLRNFVEHGETPEKPKADTHFENGSTHQPV